ncbi:hypothetical protein [Pontibacter chinhatensis]|uniref:Uncharacterized protein n=1 Tax=Pontibacter chinhatensis TaxID=1436961 RepID=A0A1I2QNW0_9BACT|nr:hypothetical protein [Pontibacter chinhatensis]SFG29670.1 hypothetical protein SAMN05421739_10258 [Pontibacter chinhatensis]
MHPLLHINTSSRASVEESFFSIASKLMRDYQLVVNEQRYRLVDIEFYYYAPGMFEDVYAHKHEAQLQVGKWYFHGSGIDITFGDGECYGGILIRAIAKVTGEGFACLDGIYREVHGPLNVKTEILSNIGSAFERKASFLYLEDVSLDPMGANMVDNRYVIKTSRIGLNKDNDTADQSFYKGKYRYVIFPHLKLKNKTQIALDMREQFPEMTIDEINRELGSRFLKEENCQTV